MHEKVFLDSDACFYINLMQGIHLNKKICNTTMAVCCRKSRRVILGKGVSCGKKVAVSTICSVRVFGK